MDAASSLPSSRCLVCGHTVTATAVAETCPACGFAVGSAKAGVRVAGAGAAAAPGGNREIAYPEEANDLTLQVEETSFWFHHRNQVIAALLERYPPGGALWDIGGGNGLQARYLQDRGEHVVLVEPGIAGCRNAAARGVSNVICGTLQALDLPEARVPALSMFDVLEHLADPAGMLAECRRVLVPDGLLYLTVPAYQMLWSDEDVYARHERRYTRAGLRRDLEQAGFQVAYIGYYFCFLVLPILLLRALPYKLRGGGGSGSATMDASEHQPSPAVRKAVDRLLAPELNAIRAGRELWFGSSVIAVAKAPGRG